MIVITSVDNSHFDMNGRLYERVYGVSHNEVTYSFYSKFNPSDSITGAGLRVDDTSINGQEVGDFASIEDFINAIRQVSFDIESEGAALNNELIINEIADFPIQDATTITIPDNKIVKGGAPITTSKRVILGKNTVWDFFSAGSGNIFTTTTTGAVFTGVDVESFEIRSLGIKAPNSSELLNITDNIPNTTTVVMDNFAGYADPGNVVSEKFGTFTDVATLNVKTGTLFNPNFSGLGLNDGISIVGSIGVLDISKLLMGSVTSATFKALDLGTAVIGNFCEIKDFVVIGLTPGSIGIDGLASSGNLAAGVQGNVIRSSFTGAITALNNISNDDIQWEFDETDPIGDSTKDAFSYTTASRTVPISVAGTFEPIAGGNWSIVTDNRFSIDSDGIATYEGLRITDIKVDGVLSVEKTGGGSDRISARINIDTGGGFPAIPDVRTESTTDNSNPTLVTPGDLLQIQPGWRFQIWVANLDGTADVIVSAHARLMIINGF